LNLKNLESKLNLIDNIDICRNYSKLIYNTNESFVNGHKNINFNYNKFKELKEILESDNLSTNERFVKAYLNFKFYGKSKEEELKNL